MGTQCQARSVVSVRGLEERKTVTTTTNSHTWIGKDIKRREDPDLLTGRAEYTSDVKLPGMLHAAVLRSPYAHARIVSIDTSAAKKVPGVHAVLTGREATVVLDPLPAFWAEPVVEHAIAVDKVRYAGEAVVAVAAESRYIAEDALELVQIEWEPLPPVIDVLEAMKPDAPKVHENLPSNVVYEHVFIFGDVDGDFARADHIMKRRLRWPRATAAPMEPAGAVCKYDPPSGRMEVWSTTNMLNYVGWLIAGSLKLAPHMVNFYPMYTGGSFGSKHVTSKVIAIAGALSKVSGHPVKFMEDRIDNLAANDAQAADRIYDAELAVTKEGKFLSLRLHAIDDYGAYFVFAITGNTNMMSQISGPYTIGSLETGIKAVLTNKNQQGVFRGAGSDIGIGLAACQQRSTYSATEFWFHNPGPATGLTTTAESVRIGVGPTGGITVTMFSPFWGNSPETVVSQVVGEEFGIDPATVNVAYESTDHGLPGAGPGGSRMTVMLSGAVRGAAMKVK